MCFAVDAGWDLEGSDQAIFSPDLLRNEGILSLR